MDCKENVGKKKGMNGEGSVKVDYNQETANMAGCQPYQVKIV